MIRVLVSGALGKMGQEVCSTVAAQEDMQLVAQVDPKFTSANEPDTFSDLEDAIKSTSPDVVVDFTNPSVVKENVASALGLGVDVVLGTTGLSVEDLQGLVDSANKGASLFFAPNFTIGAVLMMKFAAEAAPFFPAVEIVEMHHENKKDAPSGTAVQTANLIASAREARAEVPAIKTPGKETEIDGFDGARGAIGAGDIPIHALRLPGYTANQEVIFGSSGQTLTIRHDSNDRSAYMPGVMMAVRAIGDLDGLTIGLEKLMGI